MYHHKKCSNVTQEPNNVWDLTLMNHARTKYNLMGWSNG